MDDEYVYTSSYYKKNKSTFSPISRSYFKLTEMIQDYQLTIKDIEIIWFLRLSTMDDINKDYLKKFSSKRRILL